MQGEPRSVEDATALAAQDPYDFENWALSLVGARKPDERRGADRGIDGRLFFHDDPRLKARQIIFSVKSGHTAVSHLRDLRGVLERERADIGVLITLQEPTRAMLKEAASGGFYTSPWGKHPRLQVLTIADLLKGAVIDYPQARTSGKPKRAARYKRTQPEQTEMPLLTVEESKTRVRQGSGRMAEANKRRAAR